MIHQPGLQVLDLGSRYLRLNVRGYCVKKILGDVICHDREPMSPTRRHVLWANNLSRSLTGYMVYMN